MKKSLRALATLICILLFLAVPAQNCIQTTQYPSTSTISIASTGTTQIETCNWAGDYASVNFTATGSYIVNVTGGTYLTITDNLNNPVASGWSPLGILIGTTGQYRVHMSSNALCGTGTVCKTSSIYSASFCSGSSQYPSGTTNINSSGNTTITTCNWAGEYSVNNFSLAGQYTLTGTGGSANYLTVKNAAGTIIFASGSSPLIFTIPTAGVYRVHIHSSAPTGCGTDSNCHTVWTTGPVAAVPPVNNDCSGATPVTIGTPTNGSTFNATTESPSPGDCGTTLSQPGVWYSVTGTGNKLGASLCGTSWDSKIFVYSGSCGALTCVTGTDDNGPLCTGTAASATWCSVSGTNYKILVTGYSTASAFNIVVTETLTPPPSVIATPATGTVCPYVPETITGSGATTYSWSTGATTSSITVTPSVTTTYTLYGLATCASASTTVSVNVSAAPAISIVMTPTAFCAGSSATLTASGANTYTWMPNTVSNSLVINPSSNASYTVTGTGSQACNGVTIRAVAVNPLPTVTAASGTVCQGVSFTITPSGASTYSITGNNYVVTPNTTTSYSIDGYSNMGCQSANPAVVEVTVQASPVVSITSGAICAGQPFYVQPTGAASYSLWGFSNPVIPSSNSSYTVTGFSSLGCESQPAVADVTVMPLPNVAIAGPTLVCAGEIVTLTGSGASTYTWNTQANTPSITHTSQVTSNFYVIGTDNNGCIQAANLTLSVNPVPPLTLVSSQTLLCQGQSATLTASGASNYTWSSTTAQLNSITVSPTITTLYTVTGDNSVACTATRSVAIVVNTIVVTMPTSRAICDGQTTTLAVTGANTHTWSNSPSPFYFITVNPTITTSYTVGATDLNKCKYSTVLTVTVNQNPSVNASTGQPTICAGESATLDAVGALNYAWTNSLSGSSIVVSPTAPIVHNYNVTGTDENGCSGTAKVSVLVDLCLGVNENSSLSGFNVFPNPGNGVYTINILEGRYDLKVTDISGRLVMERSFEGTTSEIDLRDHAHGMYYLNLSDGKAIETVKLIKN